ncbi:XRE family transcriptional regulator [Fodinisporobacter ferrooxydans]|uniref:XRE family transcriptional regulator n=1 Tax=Fodinisporobacter ferrooxydans TaxID=2901836 RepID=A0ABY4CHR1_9BACL|nr:XRE family transcriptional regulator [Alicyclobacillaceae bacterium MYW30-H2]
MEIDYLTQHIGQTLRRLRKERGWTLDQLADVTEVSKPMLGQIERGESNPTVVTLWKIAGGLQVPFSVFLKDFEQPHAIVVRQSEQPIVQDNNGHYVVRNVLTIRHPRSVELFQTRLLPECFHEAEAHGANVTEGIWVKKGCLTLRIKDQAYVLEAGDSIHFVADVSHIYINEHDEDCEFLVLLVYHRVDQ